MVLISRFVCSADRAQIWDLFEGRHLFGDIFDNNGNHDPFKHLALMVALIGPPPAEFVQRSETTGQCFDCNGKRPHLGIEFSRLDLKSCANVLAGAWIAHEDAIVPRNSLEKLEERLSGGEKESFLHFLRSILKWLPEERRTARQLLEDPWLL